jgi:hypothetical protein
MVSSSRAREPPYEAFRPARHPPSLSPHQSRPGPNQRALAICRRRIELPPDSLLQAQVEALRILHIDVPLSAKRQFQLFCSEHFPGLADILDCLAAEQLWALLSMRVQFVESDRPHAQSAALRFGGLGRRYVLVVFDDRPAGLLSHADGSGLFPEARPKLTALSWEEIRLALMLDIGPN